MPYRITWMNPELFHASKRVRVYHTYDDDDFARGPTTHWFTLNPNCELDRARCDQDRCPHIFDVRELSTWPLPTILIDREQGVSPTSRKQHWQRERNAIRRVIQAAIESGELTREGVQPPKPRRRHS
jgi:hypothetical protein